MMSPPIRGVQYVCYVGLYSQANPNVFKSNPTLAAGDVLIQRDGGTRGNINTLPSSPNADDDVKVTVSATEMDADNVVITFHDVAGAEWCDLKIPIQPTSLGYPGTVNDAAATTTSFKTNLTQGDNYWNLCFILFTDGALQGQSRKVSSFVNTNGVITVASTFTSAPANGDPFILIGRSE
jgi:hypothetical protein